jgi:hypothetical protein
LQEVVVARHFIALGRCLGRIAHLLLGDGLFLAGQDAIEIKARLAVLAVFEFGLSVLFCPFRLGIVLVSNTLGTS